MKKFNVAIVTLALITLWSAQGFSGQSELKGMIIGAGSGAIIGHAIGGNAEAAILGSAIGSAVGVVVGNAHHNGLPFPPPFIIPPPFPPPSRFVRDNDGRHGYQRPQCRIVDTTYYKHGRPYTVTKRICNEGRSNYYGNRDRDHRDHRDYRNYRDHRDYRDYRDSSRDRRGNIDRNWNRHYNY